MIQTIGIALFDVAVVELRYTSKYLYGGHQDGRNNQNWPDWKISKV